MKAFAAVLLVAFLGGCTSVKLVQRDGCWIRQTKKLGAVKEEIGPCARAAPPWSDDRLTRLVQECVAEEAHRWQNLAIASWGRREPLPDRASESTIVERCTNDAAQSIVSDNERLEQRLSEVASDRDALRAQSEEDRSKLVATKEELTNRLISTKEDAANRLLSLQGEMTDRIVSTSDKLTDRMMSTSDKMADRFVTAQGEMSTRLISTQDKLAEYLGAAASKPRPPAVATATATSEGTARNDISSESATTTPETAPVAIVNTPATVIPAQPVAAQARAPERRGDATVRPRQAKRGAKVAAKPACDAPAAAAAPSRAGALPRKGEVTPAVGKPEVADAAAAKPADAPPRGDSTK